jgi:uncharacterized protein
MIPTEAPGLPPGVVLDTNVVLDWLVFENTNVALLSAAVMGGHVRWLACQRMREELLRALSYSSLARWNPDSERTLTSFDRWAVVQPTPLRTTHGPLVCSDPDDQVFIDLSLQTGALWLLTHDKALLKLRRAAKLRGVSVLQPELWLAPTGVP